MADEEWSIYVVDEVRDWIDELDDASHKRVVEGLDALAERGPMAEERYQKYVAKRSDEEDVS